MRLILPYWRVRPAYSAARLSKSRKSKSGDTTIMRSQEEATSDALEHAGELVNALQDADASEDLITSAEKLQSKVKRLTEEGSL